MKNVAQVLDCICLQLGLGHWSACESGEVFGLTQAEQQSHRELTSLA